MPTDHKPTPAERSAALTYARRHWKDAHSLRFEGKCPVRHCRQWTQWSIQIEGDHPRGENEETCGCFCTSCGFSNAGSRPVENDEADE